LHSDLPPTTLRGYVQVNQGTDAQGNNTLNPDPIHYLGPAIVATKDRPVRVKFTNKLPTGAAGDLFIPVDETIMGAGEGPIAGEKYTQNRGTLHLHGGKSIWISDGTPHQWITPAGEDTPYPKGVSVKNVPDMPDPGDGSQTFFYSNQQSARLMFYHDHSFGITRLNVYAGEAAPYLITDDTEKKLVTDGVIPSEQIPLVVQDKTFVDATTISQTDPTWNWGTTAPVPNTGDLWVPHVYVPAQNPAMPDGINATGRWHYGPWFWPPTNNILNPPIPNPYYDPVNAPWEPYLMPATPNPSVGMENYNDTPLVNGTAYPKMTVQPKSYRMRILNAANDRFFNLQWYVADPAVTTSDGRKNTEVKMVPASETPGFPELWPTDGRAGGVPDPATQGPQWVQIATESGFLPSPAVIPNQPITWNMNPTMFNFGNVQDHSLLLGNAERADVIVDFSKYAGKTLILYNDAPTAFPALDPRTDYYTGNPDLTAEGGTKSTMAGFGPNTRTVMQVTVAAATPAPAFDLNKLNAAFTSTNNSEGVFESSQNPVIIPDSRYSAAYNKPFSADPYVRIYQTETSFETLQGVPVTMPLEPKAIQDEQGETFDLDFGRMSAKLGLERPTGVPGAPGFILYSYSDPTTELLDDSMTPLSPVGEDGTQIWKITHNGVDTHPVHFHLFDVQLINRVGWDGFIRSPDDNELGWKETVRISPLEDTIVALKPHAPKSPFGVPDSTRPYNPMLPIGSTMGFSNIDPATGEAYPVQITNQVVNFGWEYVWHCHILSHEEMDMMRPMSLAVARSLAATPSLAATGTPGSDIGLKWSDSTPANNPATWGSPANEFGFRIERTTVDVNGVEGTFAAIGTALANQTSFVDTSTVAGTAYAYRVFALNAAGEAMSNTVWVSPPGFFTQYTITPTAGMGGAINPGTPQIVPAGSNSTTFTITPNAGYALADVLIDGVSMGPLGEYTFTSVNSDHTIWALFSPIEFTITPSAGPNGTIAAATPQTVPIGGSMAFTITPNTGYRIADLIVDGVKVADTTSYQFTNVQANHTIDVTFAPLTYSITSSTGVGGTVMTDAVQWLDYGTNSSTYSITPDPGYYIDSVLIDGVSVGRPTTYTFTNVTADHTISATFKLKTMYRFSNTNRYNSAVQGAQLTYPNWTGVTDLVVVSGENYSRMDAAAAAGLAGAYNAPMLLVGRESVPTVTRNAIAAMPAGLNVHIVGGTGAITNTVRTQLDAIPSVGVIDRIGGTTAVDTAVAVATRMKAVLGASFPTTVLLARVNVTDSMWDAQAAAPISARAHIPILYVNSTSLPPQTATALTSLGLTTRYVIGSTGAVSEAVRIAAGVPPANRLGGANMAATSVAVANAAKANGWLPSTGVGFASSQGYAHWVGAYLGTKGAPLLWVGTTTAPPEVLAYLNANAADLRIGYVFGPTSSISNAESAQLLDAMK